MHAALYECFSGEKYPSSNGMLIEGFAYKADVGFVFNSSTFNEGRNQQQPDVASAYDGRRTMNVMMSSLIESFMNKIWMKKKFPSQQTMFVSDLDSTLSAAGAATIPVIALPSAVIA
jgi:hypothetical protein